MSKLLRKQALLTKNLVNKINTQLIRLAFYKEFTDRFSPADGNSKAAKESRGGLTQSEWDAYWENNETLKKYKGVTTITDHKYTKLIELAQLYQRLYDLERRLAAKPGATLRDVLNSTDYQALIQVLKGTNFMKQQDKLVDIYQQQQREDQQRRNERKHGYKIDLKEFRGYWALLKEYAPDWWEAVEEACKTHEFICPDTGEIKKIQNEKALFDFLDTKYKVDDEPFNGLTPIRYVLQQKDRANENNKLWTRVPGAYVAFDSMPKKAQKWLDAQPDTVYNMKNYHISPICLAFINHKDEINSWDSFTDLQADTTLQAAFNKWMGWIKEEEQKINNLQVSSKFINHIALEPDATWFNTTTKIITAAIQAGASIHNKADVTKFPPGTKYMKTFKTLRQYIYNTYLSACRMPSRNVAADADYEYLPESNNKQANTQFERIINALVAA